jgi:hypothetical protein
VGWANPSYRERRSHIVRGEVREVCITTSTPRRRLGRERCPGGAILRRTAATSSSWRRPTGALRVRGSSGLPLIRGEATLSPARSEDIQHSSVGRLLKKARETVARAGRTWGDQSAGPPEPMWPAAGVRNPALLPSRRSRVTWRARVRGVRSERNSRKVCLPVRRIPSALEIRLRQRVRHRRPLNFLGPSRGRLGRVISVLR